MNPLRKMKRCPSCKTELNADHAFCPNCGKDLRNSVMNPESNEVQIEQVELDNQHEPASSNPNTNTIGDFKLPFILSFAFTVISIFIWSYVYTNWNFNFQVFISKLINNSFWIMLLPFLISLAFKKQRRASVYSNMVLLFIVIGIVLLFFGYSQVKTSQDPLIVRMQLKQPCIDNVIKQMDKYDVSFEIKNYRATKYCDCLLEKVKDADMTLIGKGDKEFWNMITQNYKEENRECVEISLQNK